MRLIWDKVGERLFETGVENGVLYVRDVTGAYPKGVAWNGLTALNEKSSGAESNKAYADDITYLDRRSKEEFGGTIEAFTYPKEFESCDGSAELVPGVKIGQQNRGTFGLVYKTLLGNDVVDTDYAYKLHIVYGATVSPSEKAYNTVNESPDEVKFSWELTTVPVEVTGHKPTATVVIESNTIDPAKLAILEGILFGTADADARLPLPDEIASIIGEAAPSALALSSISPVDYDVNTAIASNIVLTFNNKILREAVVVASEAGEKVLGVKSWDTTGKILTFNPTSDLTNNTVYIVAVTGVVDVYGQSLDAEIKNFTTVA
jgi:hypothetical protein